LSRASDQMVFFNTTSLLLGIAPYYQFHKSVRQILCQTASAVQLPLHCSFSLFAPRFSNHRYRSRPASSGVHLHLSSGGSFASSASRIAFSLLLRWQIRRAFVSNSKVHLQHPETHHREHRLTKVHQQLRCAPGGEVDEQQRAVRRKGVRVCRQLVQMRVAPVQRTHKLIETMDPAASEQII